MENNWEPRVGQKVVALTSGTKVKKGIPYTVAEVFQCSRCKSFHLTVEELFEPPLEEYGCDCNYATIAHSLYHGGNVKYFAPISEQYADMTAEIAQQFKEHPDTVDQPVKVLEVQN